MKFSELNLHPDVDSGVKKHEFSECTPVQELCIPHILGGRDVAGLAQTGTGKTAAFLLPLMDRILRSRDAAKVSQKESTEARDTMESQDEAESQEVAEPNEKAAEDSTGRPIFKDWRSVNFVLVLVPTRELAEQVHKNVEAFGGPGNLKSAVIYGGTSYDKQKKALNDGVDFVVATPGRLIDLFKEHVVDLSQVRAVIFDEADRMFDMGFKDDMRYILRRIPTDRQMLLFSATLNFDVLNVAYEFGSTPVEINVSKDQAKAENVVDEIFHVGHGEKPGNLLSILRKHKPTQVIIFSNFKRNVDRIAGFLNSNGTPAVGISSLLTQAQRNRVMGQFKGASEQNVLVATDVAARGLDIEGVDMVINFELPDDPENYVHRIGRTGRAGENGLAFSMVSDRDVEALSRIEDYVGHKLPIGWLEDADIVKEFKEFPRESGFRDRGNSGPRGNDKRGGGNRSSGNRSGGNRGPRRDDKRSAGGDRNSSKSTGLGGTIYPKRERKEGEPTAQENRDARKRREQRGRRDQSTDREAKGENQSQGTGRPTHRDRKTGRHRSKKNDQREDRPQNKKRHSSQRRKQGSGQNRKRNRSNQRRREPAPQPKSIGEKVSGFFKNLFS